MRQNIPEIGEGLDVVELGAGDEQTVAQRWAPPSDQVVLAAERYRADGSLDGVGIEFDAAIAEEAAKGIPA